MEKKLIEGLRKRKKSVMKSIFRAYEKDVYFLVKRIVGSLGREEDIEECVSDIFYKVWNSADTYDEKKGELSTWIFMITKYEALNIRRKLKKEIIPLYDEEIVSDFSVEEKCIIQEQQALVLAIIKQWKKEDQLLFIRKYVLEENPFDIIESLGITRQTFDTRLHRLRHKLKEALLVKEAQEQ